MQRKNTKKKNSDIGSYIDKNSKEKGRTLAEEENNKKKVKSQVVKKKTGKHERRTSATGRMKAMRRKVIQQH